jgi:methylmalonyl-CoA mutase
MKMGLEGMIEDLIRSCDFSLNGNGVHHQPMTLGEIKDIRKVAREITNAENGIYELKPATGAEKKITVLGITGTGGAGKS